MAVEWTDERIETLKQLWTEGLPAGEIGRRLGVTKNSVVGKVHRLGLPKRPSPIKQHSKDKDKKVAAPAPKPKPKKVKKKLIELADLTAGMCCWPEGDPGMPGFHFCGAQVVPSKPYCLEHCERAYVRSSKGSKPGGKPTAPIKPAGGSPKAA